MSIKLSCEARMLLQEKINVKSRILNAVEEPKLFENSLAENYFCIKFTNSASTNQNERLDEITLSTPT